jgi:hypothetical protein
MKVYVTKDCLRHGIRERDAKIIGQWATVECERTSYIIEQYEETQLDWYRTRSAAVVRAEEMRTAKIASLKKQIARLEALKWEVE